MLSRRTRSGSCPVTVSPDTPSTVPSGTTATSATDHASSPTGRKGRRAGRRQADARVSSTARRTPPPASNEWTPARMPLHARCTRRTAVLSVVRPSSWPLRLAARFVPRAAMGMPCKTSAKAASFVVTIRRTGPCRGDRRHDEVTLDVGLASVDMRSARRAFANAMQRVTATVPSVVPMSSVDEDRRQAVTAMRRVVGFGV
mmetsp:Transcript_73/g.215  ORF Transcript_73/g.215 Transcript_73/m.215 type:complete len:201 (-) Transcript_73:682-1284(-)